MNLGHYLFSFSGRINRAKQWAILLVAIGFEIIVGCLFALTIGFGTIADLVQGKLTIMAVLAAPKTHIFFLLLGIGYIAMLYCTLAITAKRLHDRNKAAWWLLVFFLLPLVLNIPRAIEAITMFRHIDELMAQAQSGHGTPFQESPLAILLGGAASIINLWAFVELYCLRGTVGDNRFGADPLAGRG